jgi:hypothetical protein
MEYAQIEREHRQHECDETDPEPDVRGDHEMGRGVRRGDLSGTVATSATRYFDPLFKISPPGSAGCSVGCVPD